MNRLPHGFDPAVWKGWIEYGPSSIYRHCRNAVLYVHCREPEVFYTLSTPDGCTNGTESEAAAFANTYAESHGGWV